MWRSCACWRSCETTSRRVGQATIHGWRMPCLRTAAGDMEGCPGKFHGIPPFIWHFRMGLLTLKNRPLRAGALPRVRWRTLGPPATRFGISCRTARAAMAGPAAASATAAASAVQPAATGRSAAAGITQRSTSVQPFQDQRHALPATDAQGRQTQAAVRRRQPIQ